MISKTEGKQLGKIAFYISEMIVIIMIVMIVINSLYTKTVDINLVNALFLFQGTVFSVVWGATATKKFARSQENKEG